MVELASFHEVEKSLASQLILHLSVLVLALGVFALHRTLGFYHLMPFLNAVCAKSSVA